MSTRASGANLVQAVKELTAQWRQTQAHWHDAKSNEFEYKYLAELPNHVARAMGVIEEIDVVLRKVRNDCE
jgi:murein tripeptide amidase MpaA